MGKGLTCAAGTATSRRYMTDNTTDDIRHLDTYEVPETWDELVRYLLTGVR